MNKIYLTNENRLSIINGLREKDISYKDLADKIGISTSTVCRMCTGSTKWINIKTAQSLENILDIYLYDIFSDPIVLIKEIENLVAENKMLKQLLIEKWKKEDQTNNYIFHCTSTTGLDGSEIYAGIDYPIIINEDNVKLDLGQIILQSTLDEIIKYGTIEIIKEK